MSNKATTATKLDKLLAERYSIEVGTPVHYWPSTAMAQVQRLTILNADKPLHAHIAHVFHERMVNLAVVDHRGVMHSITSVSLFYPGEVAEEGRDHCTPIRPHTAQQDDLQPVKLAQAISPFRLATAEERATAQFPTPPGHDSIIDDSLTNADVLVQALPEAITTNMVEQEVLCEYHINARDLAAQTDDVKSTLKDGYPGLPVSLNNTDICVIVMRNGHVIVGHSACISREKYSREVGRQYARENALDVAWKLMGYELRSRLVDAGAAFV